MNVLDFAASLDGYLLVGATLLVLGVIGIVTRKNSIGILLAIELVLNASAVNFVAFSKYRTGAIDGQVCALFIILIAAADAAVALAIILRFYRLKQTVDSGAAGLLRD